MGRKELQILFMEMEETNGMEGVTKDGPRPDVSL
jgi:hypothetical protein